MNICIAVVLQGLTGQFYSALHDTLHCINDNTVHYNFTVHYMIHYITSMTTQYITSFTVLQDMVWHAYYKTFYSGLRDTVHHKKENIVHYRYCSFSYYGVACILQVVVQEVEHFEFFRFI